jgi:hypothetical protein
MHYLFPVVVGGRGGWRRRFVHATERNQREQRIVKEWRGDEQRRASMKEERAAKNREGFGWESNEGIAEFERENVRELQNLRATGNKRGKNKT